MTRPLILVVDDKPNFLSLYRKMLGEQMTVLTATSGAAALEILGSQPVEVVLSDIRMPGMDGIALLREVKAQHPKVEVILVTAFGEIPQAVLAMQEGAYSYLTKPFDPEEALREIEGAVQRRRAAVESEASAEGDNADKPGEGPGVPIELPFREAIEQSRHKATREYLVELLRAVRGNVTRAAERASMERESFHRLLRRYGLRAEDFRGKD
jgi:DNA-binding NtrC family response regulator